MIPRLIHQTWNDAQSPAAWLPPQQATAPVCTAGRGDGRDPSLVGTMPREPAVVAPAPPAAFWPTALDRVVEWSHDLPIVGRRYHPYLLASDIACAACVALGAAFCARESLSGAKFVGVFVLMFAVYRAAQSAKARLGIRSRSFLQDTVLILLPTFLFLSLLVGQSLPLSLDLFALLMPLYGAIVRWGCFAGGCCYGVASPRGVLYQPWVFERVEHGCRRFHPGQDPRVRVLPTQLLESAGQAALSVGLIAWRWGHPELAGCVLPVSLLGYCCLRFGLDFLRTSSARPRVGTLSEAQVASIVVALVCAAILLRGMIVGAP